MIHTLLLLHVEARKRKHRGKVQIKFRLFHHSSSNWLTNYRAVLGGFSNSSKLGRENINIYEITSSNHRFNDSLYLIHTEDVICIHVKVSSRFSQFISIFSFLVYRTFLCRNLRDFTATYKHLRLGMGKFANT